MAKAMANTELCGCVSEFVRKMQLFRWKPLTRRAMKSSRSTMNCALAVGCATRFARIMSSRWSEKGELT